MTVYHVIPRTALEGFPLGAVEKEYLLQLIKKYSDLYFMEVLGFALMGNHYHLLVRVLPETEFSDETIQKRIKAALGTERQITPMPLVKFREKLGCFIQARRLHLAT